MATVITTEWVEARIVATQAAIVAYEAAILALSTGAQSYSLDTGQTRQNVTKANLTELRKTLEWLNSQLAQYDAQISGGAVFIAKPAW